MLAKPNWPAGVCGLAAGKIVEQMYRPAVVMEQMGDLSRCSARSVKGFDITAALAEISHLLESYGGHAMAAGFVAKTENLPQIEAQLSQLLWQQFKPEDLVPVVNIDAHIETKEINWNIFKALQQFEPNGIANPRPTFMLSNMHVTGYRQVGQEGKHLKLTLASQNQQSQSATTTTFEAIAFNLGYWAEQFASGANNIDVAFTLDENIWNGRRTLQLMVKDIRATQAE